MAVTTGSRLDLPAPEILVEGEHPPCRCADLRRVLAAAVMQADLPPNA